MAGQLKLNGITVATESNGSVQLVNTKIQLNQDDDTVIDSLGNSVISESSGQVTFDSVAISNSSLANSTLENSTLKLSSSGITIQDSNGNSLIEESNGVVTIGGNSTIVIGTNTTIPSISGGMPPGCIMSFGMTSPPAGWLVCNGASYSTGTYQELYNAIGYSWGGSGSSFNVPDLRNYFLRGLASSGRTVGDSQSDAFQGHRHGVSHDARKFGGIYRGGGPVSAADQIASITITDPTTGNHGSVRVSTETRPMNRSVQYCIKY